MKIAIAITVNDRPEYLEQVIESWHKVRGIEDTWVIFQCEPESRECQDLCLKAKFPKQVVKINQTKMSALGNPYVAIQSGFSDVGDIDFVVLGEDDSIVTADALEFFRTAARKYYRHEQCLGVCSFQYRPAGKPYMIYPRHYFASVVWGTWRNRWDIIRSRWTFNYDPAWDRMLLDLVAPGDYFFAFPTISRSQHIGRERGTHMSPEQFEELQAKRVHDGSAQNYMAIGGDS